MRNLEKAGILVGIGTLLCGCANRPYITDWIGRNDSLLVDAQRARDLELKDPSSAEAAYKGVIAAATIPEKTPAYYQKALGIEFQAMGQSQTDSAMSSKDAWQSALAFPQAYDRRIEAAAEAHLGLARLAMAKADWTGMQSQAQTALELVSKKAQSPIFMAREMMSCYELLAQAYGKQGAVGKQRLAKLSGALLKEYLGSKQGRSDFFAERVGQDAYRANVLQLDNFVAEVELSQAQQDEAAFNSALGAVASGVSTMQQMQINNAMARSGGQMTPQIQQMQLSQKVFDFQKQMLSLNPDFKKGADYAQMLLSPFASPTATEQLADPDYGPRAPRLIKAFAQGVAQLSGSAEIKKSAQLVSSSVDAVVAARGGDQAQMSQALIGFAKSFDSLQAQAENIQTQVATH